MASPNDGKVIRKRSGNFSADEKAVLAGCINRHQDVIESKLTDGRIIQRKKTAWDMVKNEFNSHPNVNKRDVQSLKKAWDNMKALTRKAKSAQRGHLFKTGGGVATPELPEHVAIINLLEQLETEKMKKQTALRDEERSVILFEAAQLKLQRAEKENMRSSLLLDMAKLEREHQLKHFNK